MPANAVNQLHSSPGVFYSHQPDSEPIPGYRLIEPLGCGGFGEVWKCEAPGGLLKAIKFVQGSAHALDANPPAEEELRAVQRVKAIRHPFILSMERVEVVATELVIVLELADKNLADLLRAEQHAGRVGIARESLLAYLREAAEALDVMNSRHGLQHLDVKPQNLFLVSNHVKVGDFGLVNSFGAGRPHAPALGAITPLYAAPEVCQSNLSAHCDQYSLAIVYQQLLTGTLPFNGKNARQLLMQHVQEQPDLQPLPAGDREVVARALSKAPATRFPSCTEFVQALLAGLTEVVSSTIGADPSETISRPTAETRRTAGLKTVRVPTVSVRPPALPTEASGFEIGDLVTRTPLTEVWNARADDGSPRLVKVLFGCARPGDKDLARLGSIAHPLLARLEILDHAPGRLVLATERGDRTLRDLLVSYQAQGSPGIPRARLLGYLQAVAEVLDFFAHQGRYHLGLNPRSLLLQSKRLLIADFGLAQHVWLPAGKALAALNPRYSAPEIHRRPVGSSCDQYSLALIYHELLTGAYPGGSPGIFNLERLPEADRAVIARALHSDPLQRWPSAVDLIAVLQGGGPPADSDALAPGTGATMTDGRPPVTIPRPSAQGVDSPTAAAPPTPVMQSRFGTNLPEHVIRERLEGFREQWKGEVLVSEQRRLVFQMQMPRSFWQRWTGKQPGLEVQLDVGTPEMQAPEGVQTRTEVRMDLRARDCTREQSSELFGSFGSLIVESVRTHLRRTGFGRCEDRVVWHHPLQLNSIQPDGSIGPLIDCQGKDISLGGIGFYLPGQLPSSHVMLHLPHTELTEQQTVAARIVRVQGCGDGWYEVGAVLLPPEQAPPVTSCPSA
jgi:serine/threonine protein kinase